MLPKKTRTSTVDIGPRDVNLQDKRFIKVIEISKGPIPSMEKKKTRRASGMVLGTSSSLPALAETLSWIFSVGFISCT